MKNVEFRKATKGEARAKPPKGRNSGSRYDEMLDLVAKGQPQVITITHMKEHGIRRAAWQKNLSISIIALEPDGGKKPIDRVVRLRD